MQVSRTVRHWTYKNSFVLKRNLSEMKMFYLQATVQLWHSTRKPNASLIFGYIVSLDDKTEDIRVALFYDSDNTKCVQSDGKI